MDINNLDIQELVIGLRRKGLKQKFIGEAIGCSQSSISDMEKGKIGKTRPAYELMKGLQKLYAQYCLPKKSKKH